MHRISKKTKIIIALIAAALLILAAAQRVVFVNSREFRGECVKMGNITVVNLSGTWYEMGRQYGELASKELQEVFAFCNRMIEAKEGNYETAVSIIGVQVEQMPYTIREFFRGAAQTSGLTVEQLYTVNAVERIAGLPKCSFAAVWGDYAADKMVAGRNYDYGKIFTELKDDLLVTIFNPCDGALSAAIVGYAGEIYAVNGMNEAGLFLELNNGKASVSTKSPNDRITGTTLLLDVLFEADSLEFLDRYFNTVNCSSSYVINVLDGKRARSYEWCTEGLKHGENENPEGLLVSTNHYNSPEWEHNNATDDNSWQSFTRRENLIRQCEDMKGRIDAQKMKEIISVPIEEGGPGNELVVYQIVAEPERQVLWVRTPDTAEWAEVDLTRFWK